MLPKDAYHAKPDRFGCPQINCKQQPIDPFNRKIGGACTAQNTLNMFRRSAADLNQFVLS
jgi:hypothetical protein